MRMSTAQFDILLEKVAPAIQRQDTNMRSAIPAKIKLEVTLSFLATGSSYRVLSHVFRVSKPAISKFIPEVLDEIYNQLSDYMKVPATEDEWKKIERGFNTRWNFPGAHGAIDGKHICIQAPPVCGSDYFNYKGSNSIVLMAVVDDDYCFIYANIGANGRDANFDLQNVQPVGSNHSSRMARQLRERYTNYFVNEGAVSWQSRMIY
ncbi:Uncharacterized protein OBRU01_21929, partial [Operophtera brumata]